MSDGFESHTPACTCHLCRAAGRVPLYRIPITDRAVRVPDPVRPQKPDTKHTLISDARTVAAFIVGWWPGLEDGITWGDGTEAERPSRSSVWRAARRIMKNRYVDG